MDTNPFRTMTWDVTQVPHNIYPYKIPQYRLIIHAELTSNEGVFACDYHLYQESMVQMLLFPEFGWNLLANIINNISWAIADKMIGLN